MGRAGSDIDNDYHSSGGNTDERDSGGHYISSHTSTTISNSSDSDYYDNNNSDGCDTGWPLWAVIASIILVIAVSGYLYIIIHSL